MKTAFTLVELLVVISIIVILLALLTPAMDKAIYRAELTVCAANMKGIGNAVTTYAAGQKRSYPRRLAVTGALAGWTPNTVSQTQWALDERPMLRSFFNLQETLYCPLNSAPDLENLTADTIAYGGCDLWFGWKFRDGAAGMSRLGDRFDWDGMRFDLLASDNERWKVGSFTLSAHPDDQGKLAPRVYQNQGAYSVGTFMGFDVGALPVTDGRWEGPDNRGKVDRNFLKSDGSALMLPQLRTGGRNDANGEREERLAWTPDTWDNGDPTIRDYLPTD